jgi:hypothetical protein
MAESLLLERKRLATHSRTASTDEFLGGAALQRCDQSIK